MKDKRLKEIRVNFPKTDWIIIQADTLPTVNPFNGIDWQDIGIKTDTGRFVLAFNKNQWISTSKWKMGN